MAQKIHPHVTGTVNIEMSITEAKRLRDAMISVLDKPSPDWVGKQLYETVDGETCMDFLNALKGVTE